MSQKTPCDLTVLMPCLNEEDAVGTCVREAWDYLLKSGLSGEVLVVDNGSTDRSAEVASAAGARVISEPRPGYGRAIRTGLAASQGSYIVFGDSDTTYGFSSLDALVGPLRYGTCDMVIGNRFCGSMERGATPLSHRIGAEALSLLGRWRYHTNVRDFHCGLRGLTRQTARELPFQTDGMEFATEMIALAATRGLRIAQVPVELRCCTAQRQPKLRAIPDGLRHLSYLLGLTPQNAQRAAWPRTP